MKRVMTQEIYLLDDGTYHVVTTQYQPEREGSEPPSEVAPTPGTVAPVTMPEAVESTLEVPAPSPSACQVCGRPGTVHSNGRKTVHFANVADSKPCPGSF